MKKKFHQNWPLLILLALSFFLFLANYVPGTYLIGWDSTNPELNLKLNLQRSIFGVWQEYRGLGTLDGMAHTTNLMHWVYSALLSLLLPTNLVRYVFTILAHFMGGLGIYFLITDNILPSIWKQKQKVIGQISGLLAALLYQFNFMTIQMFYAPFEVFSIHFALLPWGVLAVLRYLKKPNPKNLLLLFLVNLLGVSQAHVPSVFISYAILIGSLLLFDLYFSRLESLKKVLNVVLVLFMVNSFWGLPYIYSAIKKAPEISHSLINRLSTDEIFLRNLAWGDLKSLLTFGGFNLDYLDWNLEPAQFEKMLDNWLPIYQQLSSQISSIILSLTAFVGVILALITTKNKQQGKNKIWPLACSLLFFSSQLAIDTPLIKWLSAALRKNLPFYHDVFRFTLTKFSLAYVFLLSLFFALTIYQLVTWLLTKTNQLVSLAVLTTLFVMLGFISYPAFQGQFFYHRLRTNIPPAYFEVTNFLKTQDKEVRIALLPSPSLYGWHYNSWGYRGSGFIWQMIPQPTTDRAFDAWSANNETFYQQLQYALKSQDLALVSTVLEKYDISYILLDRSVISPEKDNQHLSAEEMERIIEKLELEKIWQQDFLEIYQTKNHSNSFLKTNFQYSPIENSHHYSSYDPAYVTHGSYLATNDEKSESFYPLSYLMQKRIDQEIRLGNDYLKFELPTMENQSLRLPSLKQVKYYAPISNLNYQNNHLTIDFEPAYKIETDQEIITAEKLPSQKIALNNNPEELVISINDQIIELKKNENKRIQLNSLEVGQKIDIFYFDKTLADYQNNLIEVSSTAVNYQKIESSAWTPIISEKELPINGQKIILSLPVLNENLLPRLAESDTSSCGPNSLENGEKIVQENKVIFSSQTGSICNQFNLENLPTTTAHILHFQGQNVDGRDLKIFVRNRATEQIDLEEIINSNSAQNNSNFKINFALPAWENYPKNNYLINFENRSFGREIAENILSEFRSCSLPLPLSWLAAIELTDQEFIQLQSTAEIKDIQKIGFSYYVIELDVQSDSSLVALSQSFDQGWLALSLPSKQDKLNLNLYQRLSHHRFNGWANAWVVPTGEQQIIIFYWPQLLVFAGYLLLAGTGLYLGYKTLKK